MPKTYEVLVEVVVAPSKWPKPLVAVAILVVVGCLLVSGIGYLSDKSQQQAQTATAVANANATATVYSTTSISQSVTETAYPTPGPVLVFSDVELFSTNQLSGKDGGSTCGGWNSNYGPCSDELSIIKFTFTATRRAFVTVRTEWGCWHTDPAWSFRDSSREFFADEKTTLYCDLGDYKANPESFCPIFVGYGPICPYKSRE